MSVTSPLSFDPARSFRPQYLSPVGMSRWLDAAEWCQQVFWQARGPWPVSLPGENVTLAVDQRHL